MSTKLTWQVLVAIITSLILTGSPLSAEKPLDDAEYLYCCQGNRSGWNRGQYYRRYDLNKTETFEGEVVSLVAYTSGRETFKGVHLMINTDKETIEVHVAPSWYLADQDFEITPKDDIVVKGSRINVDGKPAIIAREIKKGDRILVLRDKNGVPLWSGSQ